jgi:4'-phosphopantetheinyl transferase EntD
MIAIEAAARRLFPPDVAVAALDPRTARAGLLPEEAAAIAAAVDRRCREFTAGRLAARRAMVALGAPALPIPSGPDRAPVWPDRIVGSISHTATACVAAVARAPAVRSLGIDLEPAAALAPDLVASICTGPELAWLDAQPAARRGRLATLIFSAKECAYKAQYPLTRTLCGFDAMRVELDPGGTWRAILLRPIPPFAAGDALTGRFALDRDLILTAAALRD